MTREQVQALLREVSAGTITVDRAAERLRDLPFEELGFAKVDHHRSLRAGMPEVIFGEGKSVSQIAAIFGSLAASGVNVLATRMDEAKFAAVHERHEAAIWHEAARCVTLRQNAKGVEPLESSGLIGIVCAGTSDLPVAEEARVTAEIMGNRVDLIADVGVAGLHRLLAQRTRLQQARVLIVCAGMEGALPSVVGGMSGVPVIAVPTSVGYGAAFGGLAALLGMLNSCSPNVTVVNIDNGFGAAYVATLINRDR